MPKCREYQLLPRSLRVYVPTSSSRALPPHALSASNSAGLGISPCLWALCCCLLVGPIPSGSTLRSAVVASGRMMATLRCGHTACLTRLDDARDTAMLVEPAVINSLSGTGRSQQLVLGPLSYTQSLLLESRQWDSIKVGLHVLMMTRAVGSLQARALIRKYHQGHRHPKDDPSHATSVTFDLDATLPGSVLPFLCHPFWDHCRMLPLVQITSSSPTRVPPMSLATPT